MAVAAARKGAAGSAAVAAAAAAAAVKGAAAAAVPLSASLPHAAHSAPQWLAPPHLPTLHLFPTPLHPSPLPQPNVSNPAGAPYYYTGSTAGANLYTNTSIIVDTRLTYSELTDLLNTAAVAASIQSQILGGERARQ